jgi:2,3-bisphosphoglycerate-independent phosphoglycerate mutase
MTQYSEKFPVAVAFPPEKVNYPLGRVLSENGKIQLRIAETEKYAHVTFFFNGFKEAPYKNEYRVLIPSQRVAHHDEHPEMMAEEITNRVLRAIEEGGHDFILVNFANGDMVAHTGNYEAAQKAVQAVDVSIGRLKEAIFRYNGILIITSDHGNVERMRDPLTGERETKHDPNPVPVYLVVPELERPRGETKIDENERFPVGLLSDVAPTILELLGIPKPAEMTGQSLLKILR